MQKIIPHLWFDNQAEEAAEFYISIFKNARVREVVHYPKAAVEVFGKPRGSVMTVEFEIEGQRFLALNGGPAFKFNEALSFMVECDNQEEIDYFWEALSEGGVQRPCGWLKDKFGLSWQVVPRILDYMMLDANKAKVEAVTAAFLNMGKLDIQALEETYRAA